MKSTCSIFLLLFSMTLYSGIGPSLAEEPEEIESIEPVSVSRWDADNFPRDERGINLLTARTPRQGAWLFFVTHRAWKSVDDEPAENLLGMDSGGLKIGIGVRYAVLDRLDFGVQRFNGSSETFDTYEFDGRYRIFDQPDHGIDLAVRGGVSWFIQPDADDASGFFGQLLVNRSVGNRFLFGACLLYHSDSTSDRKGTDDEDMSWGAGALVEINLFPSLTWNIEGVWNAGGFGLDNPVTATSLKLKTFRHTFCLVLSNSQYTGADGLVAGAWREPDDLVIGFNITREL